MDIALFRQLCDLYDQKIGKFFPGKRPQQVLGVLALLREHPLTEQELADHLRVQQPAANKLVGKLRKAGFVDTGGRETGGIKRLQFSVQGRAAVAGFEAAVEQVLSDGKVKKSTVASGARTGRLSSKPRMSSDPLRRYRKKVWDAPGQMPLRMAGGDNVRDTRAKSAKVSKPSTRHSKAKSS